MKTQRSQYWRAVISGYDPKKSTVRAYCRAQEVNEHSFHAWRKRLRDQDPKPSPVTFKLVENTATPEKKKSVQQPPTQAAAACIEVVLNNGTALLRVPCEESALRIVLAAMAAALPS